MDWHVILTFLLLSCYANELEAFLDSVASCPKSSDFKCTNGDCIDQSKHCDGKTDCPDGFDELNCDQILCREPKFFQCKQNHLCISSSFVCDQENDCGDYSDEQNCTNYLVTSNANCSSNEWQCKDRLCILQEWVCNGEDDCLDGSDETIGCTLHLECDGFKCNDNHCVPNEWRCDGHPDCPDGSDEKSCGNKVDPKDCTIDNRHYLCKDDKTCIDLAHLCDQTEHCPDKSDEHGECTSKDNVCFNHNCSHECVQTPTGPLCLCPKGYHQLSEKHCQDINECERYGICDQKCKNYEGGYQCYCDSKYYLQNDNKTCKADGGEALMLFSSKTQIRAYFLTSNVYYSVASRLKQVVGVSYDGHYIYWTDVYSGSEAIVRANEHGSDRELLVSSGLGSPEDLAVDWITGNIYFTDVELQHIGVCTNDGMKCSVIVNKDIQKPRGIVLNPAAGEMYWTDWGRNPEIARSKMDGSFPTSFVTNDIKWPNGLTVDYPNERLYWVDAKLSTIESILLDGTDRRTILAGIVKHPYSIAVFEDKLYWSDWSTHSIQSCDKFTGKNHKTIVREKNDYIYGVHIFHSALKQRLNNPCAGAYCSDICLLSGMSYSCGCPEDKTLAADGHNCIEIEKKKLMVIGAQDMLMVVQHQKLGKHHIVALPVSFNDISAVTYNSLNGNVFVADKQDKKIYTVGFDDKESKVLISTGVGDITGMDFDYFSNNLYWCDSELGTVEIFSLNTLVRKVILHDLEDEKPLDIALIPEEGIMFVAFQKPLHAVHIDRLHMDGQGGRTHVIEQGLIGPFVNLVYDPKLQRVFFSDSHTGNIESTSKDGDDRHGFRSLTTEPISLAVLGNDLFWTNYHSGRVFWAEKHNLDNSGNKRIALDVSKDIEAMHLAAITGVKTEDHPCLRNNSNCSHICLRSLHDTICVCPLGQMLLSDNKTCFAPRLCNPAEFKCEMSEICVPKELRCNGKKDCLMGDDEIDCEKKHRCHSGYFECMNGECIEERKVCDFHYDCRDNSDEMNCDQNEKRKCPAGNFQCEEGNCISEHFVCDGIQDCNNGLDEENCVSLTCSTFEFRCRSGSCIPKSWECDHEFDCPDQTDEHENCQKPTCASDQFVCNNGRCLDESLHCNRIDDCGDHSDEIGCQIDSALSTIFCEDYEFQCGENSSFCVTDTARCNGTEECPKGEDEKNCTVCHSDEFECANKKCIVKSWICDKTDDCGDKSDEDPLLCLQNQTDASNDVMNRQRVQIPCENGFRCKTGHCIDMKLVCNGIENCYDGSDEYGSCESSCQRNNNPCASVCLKTPSGPKCSCHEGYKLRGNSLTCEDINECESEPKICSHMCVNTEGSFTCSCYDGFRLRPDRKSCKAIGGHMNIIFNSAYEILRLTPSQNSLEVLFSEDTPTITGLDVLLDKKYIYFSIRDMGMIIRMNLNDKRKDYIRGIGEPQLLSTDWVTGNVYFVDSSSMTNVIRACHIEEQKCARIVQMTSYDQISSLVIDSVNKYVFYSTTSWWLFNSPSSVIYKSNLDGSKAHELLKEDLGYITGLAFDHHKKILYFSDQHLHQIQSIDYDGKARAVVLKNSYVQHPIGLNLFEDYLYFLNPNGQMTKCRIHGDNKACTTFKLYAYNTKMFLITQESKQPMVKNACDDHNCTHLCIQSEIGAICVCDDGNRIGDGIVCDIMKKSGTDTVRQRTPSFELTPDIRYQTSSRYGSIIAGMLIAALIIGIAFAVYYYVRIKMVKSGKFDISMRFQNPAYGLERSESFSNGGLQAGEHEYTNPVMINPKEMEAAAEVVLQRAKQTPFAVADSANSESATKLIKF